MPPDQESRPAGSSGNRELRVRPDGEDATGEPVADSHGKPLHRPWGRRIVLPLLLIVVAVAGFYSTFRVPPSEPDAPVANDAGKPQATPIEPGQRSARPEDHLPLEPLIPQTATGLIDEAHRVADDLVQRFPQNPDAHEMRARFEYEFADIDRAVAAWQRCLELNPHYAYAHVGLAQVATQRGEFASAVENYRRAILADPQSPSHQIDLGKALLAAGEIDEALTVLKEGVKAAPDNPEGHAELGAAQLQERDYAAAKTSFETALRLDPTLAAAHFGLATVYTRLGEVAKAREHEARFTEFRSESKRDLRDQRVAYNDNEALREDIALLYTRMGGVFLAEGRPSAAERLWQRAARLHPENRECRQALAWLWLQQDKPWETIRMLRELARLEPASASYPTEIARLYCEIGRVDEAERALQDFAESSPDNATVQTALAEFYLNVKSEPASAVLHARKAAELSGAAEQWVLLSGAQELAGDLPAAVAALEEATRLAPDNLQYRQLLALLKTRLEPRGAAAAPEAKP